MLDLIDPRSGLITARYRVSPVQSLHGHGTGTTSAAYGDGYLFASDHGRDAVEVLDARSGAPVATIAVPGGPESLVFDATRGRPCLSALPRGR
ncbi:MAG: hypothetical protein HKM03_00740 [Steroidobacteraceae bacterium]|nr:hypothetical protein [Steroidobacteraceae bacterium]